MKKFFAVICVSFLTALMVFAGIRTESPSVNKDDMKGFAVTDMGIPASVIAIDKMEAVSLNVYAVNTMNLDTEVPTETNAKVYLSSMTNGANTTGSAIIGVIRPNLWPMTSYVSIYNQQTQLMPANSKERSIAILPECSVNVDYVDMSVNMKNCEMDKKAVSNFKNQRC